jgi:redox-sensitive bicupin YhaK (pirin superfamily)
MYHAEINNDAYKLMRFIQMWFIPSQRRLEPAIQQMRVAREDRANRFLLLVSYYDGEALPIHSEGEVHSSFLQAQHAVKFAPRKGWGVYLYLLEGGPIRINEQRLETLDAAMVTNEKELDVRAELDAELLLVHVQLT